MENKEKKLTEEELLQQFEEFYDNYLGNLIANINISGEIARQIFAKNKDQEILQKFLEYFFEMNRTAIMTREIMEEKGKEILGTEES